MKEAESSEKTDAAMAQNKERKLRMPLSNILSIDNNSELFKSIKQVAGSPTCHTCGLSGSLRCSQCHQTYYCSKECQKQDWKAHSELCRPAGQKETNGIKPPSGAGDMSKTKAHQTPDKMNEDVYRRKIMLFDILGEALGEGTEFEGFTVEYSSPSNFFVSAFDAKSVDKLVKVTNTLKKFYSDPSNIRKDYIPDTGEVCVAKYRQDRQWYRALVCNVEKTLRTAHVLYLDYGNTESVSLDIVQPVHKDVELIPPCALHCCLAHVTAPPFGWSSECLVEVKKLLVGSKLLIRITDVISGELPLYMVDVSLIESGKHVNKIIIEKGYSFPPQNKGNGKVDNPETGLQEMEVPRLIKQTEMPDLMQGDVCKKSATPKPETLSSLLCVGDDFKACVTIVHNPEMFFCQRLENAQQLTDVMVMMHQRYSTSVPSPGFLPAVGEICVAQFTEDNTWYRASVVRRVSEESLLVGYLDFGNTEILPISRVRRIEPDLLSIPFQATQCCLAGVKPPSGEWTSEAIESFKVLVMNKILSASVVANCGEVLTLELVDESVTPKISISQHLIEAGLAVPNTQDCESPQEDASQPEDYAVQLRWAELPLGQETEVLVCMLQNPGVFFCHIHNQTDLQFLNKLNITLGEYCMQHKSEAYHPAREEICGAYYAGDRNWYRAQVKDFTPSGDAKILFLDYGNIEDASLDKLCKIPSSFLEFPFQAICCSLFGIIPAGENWSPDSAKAFQKSVVGLRLLAKAVRRTKHGYSIELVAIESGAVIADILIAANVAVREEDSAKNGMDVNDGKVLRPPGDLSLTCNSDKGSLKHKELQPMKSSPSIVSDAQSVLPKSHKELPSSNAAPRNPTDKRESHSGSLQPMAFNDVRLPKSIPSAIREPAESKQTAPSCNNSSKSCPKDYSDPKPPSLFQKALSGSLNFSPREVVSSKPFPMRSGSSGVSALASKQRHTNTLSPSSVQQVKPISTATKESGFTNSPMTPISGKSPSFVSPPPSHHRLLSVASLVDSCKPNSLNSSLSTSREFQFSNSSSSGAEKGTRPGRPSSSDDCLQGKTQKHNNTSVNGFSAASGHPPGVSIAQTWISVDLPLNKAIAACVLKTISPDLFYVFPKENRVDVKRLQQVMMEIFQYCSKETDQNNYRPSVGDACCAKFSEDGQWYRAVVLEVHESSARIAYADYGNMEVLPFSSLLPMKETSLELPMQLTKCALADVLPVTESWSPEATSTLASVLLGAEVLITVKSIDAGIYRVSVDREQENGVLHVGERLVMDGLARSLTVTPMTKSCLEGSGCCCHDLLKRVEKQEERILQLEEKILRLLKMK
ncbi:tudor domain-containing protein 1 isoform X2 [Dendropsophus ebraccatus]|uniref:tudor domain-containing protein 1 isoform X2 n=1 Tax=Dendropsophus ebraccatus TaxID=150705 RepID=UPI0038317AD2